MNAPGNPNAAPALPRPLDPQAAALLALVREAGYPPLEALSPAQARQAYLASLKALDLPGEEVGAVEDITIEGPGGPLPLRLYRPLKAQMQTATQTQAHAQAQAKQAAASAEPALSAVLYLHGGGWVIGDLRTHDSLCRRLANTAQAVVVAVDYRLAPEHPFPAALEDAACALAWLGAEAGRLGIRPDAIGVAGDSAGGNLAAVLALMARGALAPVAGARPLPALAHQALLYPVTDLAAESPSYRRTAPDLPLSAATMRYFIGHYTPEAADRLDWRASPLRAPILEGAAPALVLTVAHDPLCDEGRAYAERLSTAGVRVTHLHCNDQMHGLLGQARRIRAARVALDQVALAIGHELHTRAGARRTDSQEPRSAAFPIPPGAPAPLSTKETS